MYKVLLIAVIFFCSCSNTYYIVRHAEKETQVTNTSMMSTDVPLSEAGKERAIALLDTLQNKNIRSIFSTNTIRTTSTAKPLSDATGIQIQIYDHTDPSFIDRLRAIKKNVLMVGHSNTVDDIVNKLTGVNHLQDLPDAAYGDLFVVERRNNNYTFRRERFGR